MEGSKYNNNSKVNVHSILTAVSSKPIGQGKTHKLSTLDHAMAHHTLNMVFYFKKNPMGVFDLDPLRLSLSEVLSMYPVVTGRLAREGETGNWEVKCNDAGVRVLRAKVGIGLDEWLRFEDGCDERDLTVWEVMPQDPRTWSPFRIQINEFEGGGIAIGLSCSHMQADITSLTLLFRTWTQTHLHKSIDHPPLFKPFNFQGQPFSLTKSSNYFANKAGLVAPPSRRMATATFKFSNSAVKECINEVNYKCPEATPFDFLAALFWTRVEQLKDVKNEQNHQSLSICLDSRGLVKPALPLGYFGNALQFSRLSFNDHETELDRKFELEDMVALVHNHVAGIGEKEVMSFVNWLESQKGKQGEYTPPSRRMYGPELTCLSMEHMITGHQSLMYTAYFEDNEKPVHVACHVGNADGEGLIVIMPSAEGGLSRTVIISLPEEEMVGLCKDEVILRLKPTIHTTGK